MNVPANSDVTVLGISQDRLVPDAGVGYVVGNVVEIRSGSTSGDAHHAETRRE